MDIFYLREFTKHNKMCESTANIFDKNIIGHGLFPLREFTEHKCVNLAQGIFTHPVKPVWGFFHVVTWLLNFRPSDNHKR